MYQGNSSTSARGRFIKKSNADGGFRRNGGGAKPWQTRGAERPSFGSNSNGRPIGNRGRRRTFGETIDVSQFISKSQDVKVEKVEIKNTFSDFKFSDMLNRNLKKRNYVTPTPIQDQAINHITEGRDIVGLANTGTGKTAAFLLPMIEKVYKNQNEKVLIVTPTRELAQQIESEFRQFAWDMKIFSAICVGGAPIYKQIGNLKRNPSFVIGTPGRLKDLSDRRIIQLHTFKNVVLDEVDRMLDMGFIDEIRDMLKQLPEKRQSLFFSATLPLKIRNIVSTFLIDPITIEIKDGQASKNVDQSIIKVRSQDMKFTQLSELLHQEEVEKALIFVETKREVEKVTSNLIGRGFKAESIHGDKKQNQRQRALKMFRDNLINVLVATDVAARGLDVKDISHVINYTIPQTYDDYIHRIGRTGRADNKGFAYTFVE